MCPTYRSCKPLLDRLLAAILLLTFSWLFLLIIFVYFLTVEFPIFFKQRRIGKDERIFTLYKFRTLRSSGILEARKFRWGNFLRITSLDELPQLINVLSGEMSLVGPRPLPTEYLPLFSTEQRKRHAVKPGITGWAQVNGRHSISWEEKFKLDRYYVDNLSLFLDLKILIKTMILIFSFRKDVSLAEKKFRGA